MFIIERRTAGVLAALATTAALVVLGTVREPVDVAETPTTSSPKTALATSAGPGVGRTAFAANEARAAALRVPEHGRSWPHSDE